MGLTDRMTNAWNALTRSEWPTISFDQLFELMSINGNAYLTGGYNQTIRGTVEEMDGSFGGLVQQAYKSNGVVFACMLARQQLFTEARFQFQALRNGRPADLFSTPALDILEHPWPNGVTGDLLSRAIQDADIAGNFFATKRRGAIRRLRPDWVTFVLGSPNDPEVEAGDIDAEVLGYIYHPGGRQSGREPEALLRSEVAHFAPIPDPTAAFRGMSWLTPIMREISADKQMTEHKSLYLTNGATPNIVVSLDKDATASQNPAAFAEWVELFKKLNPTGGWEKFKTMYLAGGTKMEVVGSTLQQIDFKAVQGAGETRIAAAAGVPPVIVGLSEGLQAATYSNYGQARRRFADNTMRPLWRNMAGSLETLVPPPGGSRLWYDDRDIQALAEDKKDLAEVRQLETQQIRTLVDGGYTPDSVVAAVTTGDFSRLVHTGLFSVQLQPPGTLAPAPAPAIVPAKRDAMPEIFAEAFRSAMMRPQPEIRVSIEPGAIAVNTPDIHVDATTTIEPGAVVVNTPEVRNEVTVEPTPVEVRNEVSVEPTPITIEPSPVTVDVHVPETPPRPVRKTIERDQGGQIVAIVEEPDGE